MVGRSTGIDRVTSRRSHAFLICDIGAVNYTRAGEGVAPRDRKYARPHACKVLYSLAEPHPRARSARVSGGVGQDHV